MEKEKFVVKVKKNYGETSVVSARLPMEIVKNWIMQQITLDVPETN